MSDIFSSKKNQSSTDNSSHVAATDASANAGTNSMAVSGGGSLTVENLSDDVALGSIVGMRDVSGMALKSANDALSAVGNVSTQSLGVVGAVSAAAMDNAKDLAAMLSRENQDERTARSVANESNASLAQSLAAMVTESKRDPDNQLLTTLGKYGAWIAGAFLALGALFLLTRNRTK